MSQPDFLKLTDEQLQQKYQLEIELISARDQFRSYAQAKLSNVVTGDKYRQAVKQIDDSGDSRVFQAIGKAFLLRKNDELKGDYTELLKQNEKEHDEISVRIYF